MTFIGQASAQQSNECQSTVGGDFFSDVRTDNVTTIAIGTDNVATNDLASVRNAHVGGDFTSMVKTDNVTSIAIGTGNQARNTIGSVVGSENKRGCR